jgi:hypothetical protein
MGQGDEVTMRKAIRKFAIELAQTLERQCEMF